MMIQMIATRLDLYGQPLGLAQVPTVELLDLPQEETIVFSNPQFLVALISGVTLAFAFQLLLTNLSVAFVLPTLGEDSDDYSESWGSSVRKIETKIGAWTLVTVTIALFIACFLAVKLSLVGSAFLGAIIGVVIWSLYFSLLMWFGSATVGSLLGSLISTASAGVQGLMGTAATAVGVNAAKGQAVSTAEEITAAVRREFTAGLDPDSIGKTLQGSLSNLALPKLDLKAIGGQFEQILKNSDLQAIADSDLIRNIDRQTLVDLVSSRTDFSKQEVDRIVDQLEGTWQRVIGQKDPKDAMLDLLKAAAPEDLKSGELTKKLEQLIETQQAQDPQGASSTNRPLQLGLELLTAALMGRVDLSDVDVEQISGQFGKLKEQVSGQATKLGDRKPAFNTIKADVGNYITNAFPWHLNRESVENEFKEVIYDTGADPGAVRRQLEELNQPYFVELLTRRGDLDQARIEETAGVMENLRQKVLESVKQAEEQEQSQDLRHRIENYLRSTGKEELNPEGIERDFKTLLEDPEAGIDALRDRVSQFDRNTLVQLLEERQDISEEEAGRIVDRLEGTRDRVISQAQELQEQARSKADQIRSKVEDYLRQTNKEELNPEGIKRNFRTLLEDPQAGFAALQMRLSQFDRDTLAQLLSQRQDLSEEQVNQTLDRLEEVRDNLLQAPQKLAGRAKEQYEQTTSAIAEYLRNTNLEEIDPEGIQRDLTQLLQDPQEGATALRQRLARVDRETLVKLLGQRGDLSEEQIDQTIDRFQEGIRGIIKAPQRLASRTQKQVRDFGANLEKYLRSTNKEELDPEGIKRDLKLLLQSPQEGLSNLGDRVSQFDRPTLVALLSQREDITEEEANQIVERIEAARDSLVEQAQEIQQTFQSAIDGIFNRIRDSLNSLDRPELNYEGIEQDFSRLFDDPQVGLESLRDRLSQVNRDTLVAIISSREDISEADANRVVDQIEAARDSVLQRAERIQQEAQKRINALKDRAKKQAIATKDAATSAAWWLFGTALTSLIASAIAGVMAISGLAIFS